MPFLRRHFLKPVRLHFLQLPKRRHHHPKGDYLRFQMLFRRRHYFLVREM
jgi:hypothetical protein